MGRTIFIYGLTAGVLTLMLVGAGMGIFGFDHGMEGLIWGYFSMIVGLSLMFIGVRRYEAVRGAMNFGTAFGLGLGIVAVAALVYVIGWEAYLAATDYRFADQFASQMITSKIAEGASPAELAAVQADMTAFKVQYANPLVRLAMTLLEIAPVGLILALLAGVTMRTPRGDDHSLEDDDGD